MGEDRRPDSGEAPVDSLEMIGSLVKLIDPTQAYTEVLRLAVKWFQADWGQIIAMDVESGKSVVKAVWRERGAPDPAFSSTILDKALKSDQPICIPDAKQHSDYRTAASILDSKGPFLSVIVVPLHNHVGEALGALYLQREGGEKPPYKEGHDLQWLGRLMDKLAPLVFEQDQQTYLRSLRLQRIRETMSAMGFIVGHSRAMDGQVYDRIERFAETDLTVCIQGETGTGKELIARAIHELSPRRGRPFVRVPCNAIPEGLAESAFFGHVKGAFAQAYRSKKGQFEAADGGTIFLDEISRLPAHVQAKLLHVLDKGPGERVRFCRVGGVEEVAVDIRVVASSNKNLRNLLAQGVFLEDLYHRLNQLPLHVPPLRERREDIIPLAKGFLEEAGKRYQQKARLSDGAQRTLLDHDWPGNVRELKSCIQRVVLLHEGTQPIGADRILRAQQAGEAPNSETDLLLHGTRFRELSKKQKQRVVRAAMEKYQDTKQAAAALGVSRQTIYNYVSTHVDS